MHGRPESPSQIAALYKRDEHSPFPNTKDGDGLTDREQHQHEVMIQRPAFLQDGVLSERGSYNPTTGRRIAGGAKVVGDVRERGLIGEGGGAAYSCFDDTNNKASLRQRNTDRSACPVGMNRPEQSAFKYPGAAPGQLRNTATGANCEAGRSPTSGAGSGITERTNSYDHNYRPNKF